MDNKVFNDDDVNGYEFFIKSIKKAFQTLLNAYEKHLERATATGTVTATNQTTTTIIPPHFPDECGIKDILKHLKKVFDNYLHSQIQMYKVKALNRFLAFERKNFTIKRLTNDLNLIKKRNEHLLKQIGELRGSQFNQIRLLNEQYEREKEMHCQLQKYVNDLKCNIQDMQKTTELKIKDMTASNRIEMKKEKMKLINANVCHAEEIERLEMDVVQLKRVNDEYTKENGKLKEKIRVLQEQVKSYDERDYSLIKRCLPSANINDASTTSTTTSTSPNGAAVKFNQNKIKKKGNFSTVATVKSIQNKLPSTTNKRKLYNPKSYEDEI